MGATHDWQCVDFCDDREPDVDRGLLEGTITDVNSTKFACNSRTRRQILIIMPQPHTEDEPFLMLVHLPGILFQNICGHLI